MIDRVKIILGTYTGIMFFFFYLPLIMVGILSFKADARISFPITQFSLYWYVGQPGLVGTSGFTSGIFYDTGIVTAIVDSVILGIVVALIATPLVTAAGLAFRYRFRGRDFAFYLLISGFVIPAIVMGLGTNFLYKEIAVRSYSLWTALPLQIVYVVPFGLVLMLARFDPMMVDYENAARCLGASGWKVFRKITYPLIRTQFVSVLFFSFTLSLAELLRTSFVIAGSGTIPTYVYNQMSVTAPTPKWFALGTLTTVISLALLLFLSTFLSRGQRRVL
jgi:putative spermidine/putrescine transport system permease protein